jgi:hypothetical protein
VYLSEELINFILLLSIDILSVDKELAFVSAYKVIPVVSKDAILFAFELLALYPF